MLLFRATRPLVPRARALSTTDLSQHKLNCGGALKKIDEGHSFSSLSEEEVSVLQGIGPERLEALHTLGIKTIPDLANYKHYHTARAIVALSVTEEDRPAESVMNINKALDKVHETQSFQELVNARVTALQGISDLKKDALHELGVNTIGDLAKMKYCRWAESMVWLSKFEE
jgi:predicted RecB family nuclease